MNELLRQVVLSYKPKNLTFNEYMEIRSKNRWNADYPIQDHYEPDYQLIKDFTWNFYMTKEWDLRLDIPGSYVSNIHHDCLMIYYRLREANLVSNEPDIWWFNFWCAEHLTIAMSEELIRSYDKILESNKFEMYRFINLVRRYRGAVWATNGKHSNLIYDTNWNSTKAVMKHCIETMVSYFPDIVREKKLEKLLS